MKNTLKILCLMIVALNIVGCNKNTIIDTSSESSASSENSGVRYAEKYENVSLSEAGIIYDGKEGRLHLVTIDEGEDMILCYNPNCSHPQARATYGDPECMAALYEGVLCETAYYEGAVYFFVGTDVFKHRLYKMETNGPGRELLAEFPFTVQIGYACIFREDKLYYTARIAHKDEFTNKQHYSYRIVEIDLLDYSYRFITEESKDIITIINLAGDTIFTRIADVDNSGYLNLITVDINTLEEKVVIPAETWVNEYTYIDAYDEDSYFYWSRQTYELGIRNVDGTIEKILLEGAEGESYGWVDPSCDGMYYERELDYGDEKAGHYFMDFSTGEVTNITDEQAKYGICGYDGYYDVFVARDYDFNWSMWSKEKVLGEAKE